MTQFTVTAQSDPQTLTIFQTFCLDLFHDIVPFQPYAVDPRTDLATVYTYGSEMAYLFQNYGVESLTGKPDQAAAVQLAPWDLSLDNHTVTPSSFVQDADGTCSSGDEGVFAFSLGVGPDTANSIIAPANQYLAAAFAAVATQGGWLDADAPGFAIDRGQSLLIPQAQHDFFFPAPQDVTAPEPATWLLAAVGAGFWLGASGLKGRRRRSIDEGRAR